MRCLLPSPRADGEPNALRAYFEAHRDGPGIYKGRHYFDLYVRHLAGFVGREVVVVEVGVYSGGSLGMWRSYFGENATIHGVDIQEACRVYEADGFHIHVGDQADRAFWTQFKKDVPVIDVLIDDGGHHPNEMGVTFEEFFPCHPAQEGSTSARTSSIATRSSHTWVGLQST